MDSTPIIAPPRFGLLAPAAAVTLAAVVLAGWASSPGAEDYRVYSAVLRDYPCSPGCFDRWPKVFVVDPVLAETVLPGRLAGRFDPAPSPRVVLDRDGAIETQFRRSWYEFMEEYRGTPGIVRFGRVHYGLDGRSATFWMENDTSPRSGAGYFVDAVKVDGEWRIVRTSGGWIT